MTPDMQRALLRRACARVSEALAVCRDLPVVDLFEARMAMIPVLGLASRNPVLALPWHEKKGRGRMANSVPPMTTLSHNHESSHR